MRDGSSEGTRGTAAWMMPRRRFVVLAGATAVAATAGISAARAAGLAALASTVARLEQESGGRLGVAVLDTRDGARLAHRASERFPLCSTFKLLAAAAILARVDAGQERLDRRVTYDASALVEYSPVTKDYAGAVGMTLDAVCEAAMTLSDNTAGNLLLEALGGPAGLTAYVRTLGDTVTRLDRIETALNEAAPGDPRDTTTPGAMLNNLQRLAFGEALKPDSRERLIGWLLASQTGGTRLKAGLPKDWRIGDKTGSGDQGTANDVAVIWPPNRPPMIVACYLTGTKAPIEKRNAAHAELARAIVSAL